MSARRSKKTGKDSKRAGTRPAPTKADSPRRPNRAHGAIDRLPEDVRLQMKDWLLGRPNEKVPIPRLTYEKISEKLSEMGHEISRSQVARWFARQRNDLERLETVREKAQALAKYLVPDGTDVEGAAVALTNALCLEALADADVLAVQSISDLASVAHSLGRLQTSQVAREKWELERRKKVEEAVETLKTEMQKRLEGRADLVEELLGLVDEAQEALMV